MCSTTNVGLPSQTVACPMHISAASVASLFIVRDFFGPASWRPRKDRGVEHDSPFVVRVYRWQLASHILVDIQESVGAKFETCVGQPQLLLSCLP
jgi:hypothetical protein